MNEILVQLASAVENNAFKYGDGIPETPARVSHKKQLIQRAENKLRALNAQQVRETRIDENQMYIRELTRHYYPVGPDEPYIPIEQFHERIAELKGQES